MTEEEKRRITSNDYADLLIEYALPPEEIALVRNEPMNIINNKYAVIYFPVSLVSRELVHESGYSVIPNLYGLLETSSLEEMGVLRVQNTPFLSLFGQGVLLGFVDTGIDYTSPLFKYADNTTRIVSIWDQTAENPQAGAETFFYGTEYTREQINSALQSAEPLSVVPTVDEIGHGTTLAGLAGGSRIEESDFSGVAPLTEYAIVKLKPAKQNIKDFYFVPQDVLCYQENDIMFALQYLVNIARNLQRPIAICIGLGTNQGGHDGRNSLDDMVATLGNQVGIVITVAAGNEGNRGHHYFGEVDSAIGYNLVELMVGDNESGFSMELWGNIPGIYSLDILSPSGEYIPRIPARFGESREIRFIFENTIVYIDYLLVEAQTGDQLTLIRFNNPAPGIWRFKVYAGPISSGFHIWLPMHGFITEQTAFIRPNPDTTITGPGNAAFALTVTAYDQRNQSIYLHASRGFTRTNIIKPELAAPGVEVFSPLAGNTFGGQTGSSIAAALTAGVTAMLLEWGIIKGNNRIIDTIQAKKYLIRGVNQNPASIYPNKEWGYGTLDIYRTFQSLQGDV